MTALSAQSAITLDPVRRALRAAAQKQADELHADADRQARALLDDARSKGTGILAAAAEEGRAAAVSEAALRSARMLRQAHELVLAQRNSLRLELHRRLEASTSALKADARYADLLKRLTEQCREILGSDASVAESPEGGIVAEAGSRRLDLSLPVLLEMTLDSMPEAREPWTR